MARLQPHPLAEIFPLIEGDAFDEMMEDVREHGIVERIELLDGRILDGRNRYNMLVALVESGEVLGPGWGHRAGEPLQEDHLAPDNAWFRKFNRNVDGDPLPWVLSKNLQRRHLTDSQRAMVAANIGGLSVGRPAKVGNEPVDAHIPPIGGISARARAAMVNVSTRNLDRADAVKRNGVPELQDAVLQGRVAVSAAEALAELPASEQAEIVARGEKEILAQASEIRARKRQMRFNEVNERLVKISEGNRDIDLGQRYCILYLDPATRFVSGFGDRSIENHYPTMTWDEIRALPIPQLAADDAVIFCWTTVPHLVNTLDALARWGFDYVSEWVWDKVDQGTGYWGFNQHEVLLIAKRGKFPAPLPGTQPRSLYREQKSEHSAKPDWFADQIARIWPNLPKVELFARAPRPGWAVWGNQSSGDTPCAAPATMSVAASASSGAAAARTVTIPNAGMSATMTMSSSPAATAASGDVSDATAPIDIPNFLPARQPATAEA